MKNCEPLFFFLFTSKCTLCERHVSSYFQAHVIRWVMCTRLWLLLHVMRTSRSPSQSLGFCKTLIQYTLVFTECPYSMSSCIFLIRCSIKFICLINKVIFRVLYILLMIISKYSNNSTNFWKWSFIFCNLNAIQFLGEKFYESFANKKLMKLDILIITN